MVCDATGELRTAGCRQHDEIAFSNLVVAGKGRFDRPRTVDPPGGHFGRVRPADPDRQIPGGPDFDGRGSFHFLDENSIEVQVGEMGDYHGCGNPADDVVDD